MAASRHLAPPLPEPQDVAAVVFPSISPHVSASTGSPHGGRTHLVDALAAAATAGQGDSVAARLAHSPRVRLHHLSQDSMLRRGGEPEEEGTGSEAASGRAARPGEAGQPAAQPGTPPQAGCAGAGASPQAGLHQTLRTAGQQGLACRDAALGIQAAGALAAGNPAAAAAWSAGAEERTQRPPLGRVSPEQAQRLLPPSPFGARPPSPEEPAAPWPNSDAAGCSMAEQPGAAALGRPAGQAEAQKAAPPAADSGDGGAGASGLTRPSGPLCGSSGAAASEGWQPGGELGAASQRASLDGGQRRRASGTWTPRASLPSPAGLAVDDCSAPVSPRSTGAGSLHRASSAEGPLPLVLGVAGADAAGARQQRRGPVPPAPFASLGDLVGAAISSSPPAMNLPPRLPPRLPPPKPTAQHPMVVNIFRVRAGGGGQWAARCKGWRGWA